MSEDTTNNVAPATVPADDEPVVIVPNGIPESAPVPEVPLTEAEIEKTL